MFAKPMAALTAGIVACCISAGAEAAKIKVSFGGALTEVYDNDSLFGGQVAVGTSFTAGFVYDQAAPNTDPRPDFGFYQGAVSNFFINFGNGFVYQQDNGLPYTNVQIGNDRTDYGPPAFDGFYAYGQVGNFNAYAYAEIGLTLQSFDLTALLDAALPDALDGTKFIGDPAGNGVEFHAVYADPVNGFDFNSGVHAYGVLRYLSTTPVPEPATAALLIVAVLGLAGMPHRAGPRPVAS